MGVSKVEYNGETLIDLTGDTVTPNTLAEGATAHDMAGNPIVGTMATGDFIIHIKCTPQYEYFDSSASGGTSNPDAPIEPTPYIHGDYWVYSPHQLTPEEYITAYNAKRPLKVKAEITRDDDSSVTVIAPCTGENSSDPWGLVFTVNHNQEEFKFTLHQGKYSEQSDGTPIYRVYVRVHDIVDILTKVNMVTEITPDATDDTFPSALAVVSYVDEAIQDVGSGSVSAEKEIFYVSMTYEDGAATLDGVTYNDILTAYNKGKRINAKVAGLYGESIAPMSGFNNGQFMFNITRGSMVVSISVREGYNEAEVTMSEMELQRTSRLTTAISASSTDTQYPSAKAVYKYVQANAGGGGGESASNTFIVKLLTSLSASGLSLSLPSDVTYSDVNNAVDNGLHVIAIADIPSVAGDIAGTYAIPFAYKDTSGDLIFSVMVRDMNLCVIITPSGAISFTYFFAEQSGRKVDSIDASMTHVNYPSAKAVYDFVQNEKQIEYIDGTFEMSTMSYSTDTTFEEIMSMVDKGKYVVAKSTITFGGTPKNIAWMPLTAIQPSSVAVFEGTMQANLSALNPAYKLVLLAISVEICPDGTIYTRVRVISTTNLN